MAWIQGKYGRYKVSDESKKKFDSQNDKKTHQAIMRSVKKEFPNIKLNGESPFKSKSKALANKKK